MFDRDVVAAEFLRQRARQPDHAGFRRDRVHPPQRADMRGNAAKVDDAAAARGDDVRRRRLRAVERAVQRGAEDLAPFLRRDLGEFASAGAATRCSPARPAGRTAAPLRRSGRGLRGVGNVGQVHVGIAAGVAAPARAVSSQSASDRRAVTMMRCRRAPSASAIAARYSTRCRSPAATLGCSCMILTQIRCASPWPGRPGPRRDWTRNRRWCAIAPRARNQAGGNPWPSHPRPNRATASAAPSPS